MSSRKSPHSTSEHEEGERAAFAQRELDARTAAARERELEGEQLRDQAAGVDAEGAAGDVRGELEHGQDAAAVCRFGFLLQLYLRAKRGRVDRKEVDDKRQRLDARAARMGPRLGGRLGRLFGGALFWAGVVAEVGTEALEDMIDAELEQRDQAAAARATVEVTPTPEART